uniref:Uncharacterized protein n=1 Tax=Rhinolophus ferrumequinum TaxID=59479 RepID=A0A671EMG5_RHIFE
MLLLVWGGLWVARLPLSGKRVAPWAAIWQLASHRGSWGGGACLQREDTGLQRAVPLLSHLVRAQISVCWRRCVPCLCTEVEKSEDGRKACLYRNLARTEFGVTCFSYCTSVINLAFLPYIFTQNNIIFGSLPLQILLYGIIGNLTVITPALLHFVTNVARGALNNNVASWIPTWATVKTSTVFYQNDVKIPNSTHVFTTFYAKTKSLLVHPGLFPLLIWKKAVKRNRLTMRNESFVFMFVLKCDLCSSV